jgi:hypothetical protein
VSKGLSGSTETYLAGVVTGGVLTLLALVGACQSDPSPKEQADHNCEQAWVDANDGDPSTKPAPLITQKWCIDLTAAMTTTTAPEAP